MRLIQSSIIIVSLTLLATCFAKNEASVRGLKKAKGSKLPTKSVKSFKSSKKAKAAKSDKTKTGKVSNPSPDSKTAKGKKGGSGSKYGSKYAKSCNFEKSQNDFNKVIEEYEHDDYEDKTLKKTGVTSLLDPVGYKNFIELEGDFVSICLEDAVVECSRRCAEQDGKCSMFEVTEMPPNRTITSPMHYCYLVNNKVNDFNPRRIYQTSKLSHVKTYVYNNKLAPPLKVDVMPEGLFPANETHPSADFISLGLPSIICVGTQGLRAAYNETFFDKCKECVLPLTKQHASCIDITAGVCGTESPYSGGYINFFSDFNCGEECFSGYRSNFACLSKLQTYLLAIEGQAFANLEELGGPSFGCTTSNIFDPITGDKFPDYTCPPNTVQPLTCTPGLN